MPTLSSHRQHARHFSSFVASQPVAIVVVAAAVAVTSAVVSPERFVYKSHCLKSVMRYR